MKTSKDPVQYFFFTFEHTWNNGSGFTVFPKYAVRAYRCGTYDSILSSKTGIAKGLFFP